MVRNRFVVIVSIILIIFLGTGFLISRITKPYSGPPALTVSEEVGDLGVIKADQPQAYIFTLKNEGGGTLIIERVQASCGCTATVLSDNKLSPGKTTKLEVSFNPKGYQGDVSHSVYIYSNDPENPRRRVAIKAAVEAIPAPRIHLSTSQWDFGLLSSGDTSSFSVIITNKGQLDLNIEDIVLPEQVFYQQDELEFPVSLTSEEELEVKFIYDTVGQAIGLVREYIRLTNNDPDRKYITIRMDGYIKEKEETITIRPLQEFMITGEKDYQISDAKFLIKNNSHNTLKGIIIGSSQDYITPLIKELSLSPGEEKEITFRIEQQNLKELDLNEIIREYIYFRVPVPLEIGFDLP